ncbi:unnamed protein product [Amoebophrya sp. A120]|nr:unnamed protein product [Amoebophrya sp. A120]|eukprot:GSA120T00015472001.1
MAATMPARHPLLLVFFATAAEVLPRPAVGMGSYSFPEVEITIESGPYYKRESGQSDTFVDGNQLNRTCTKLIHAAPNHWYADSDPPAAPGAGGFSSAYGTDEYKQMGGLRRLTREIIIQPAYMVDEDGDETDEESSKVQTYPELDGRLTFEECVHACLWYLEPSVEREEHDNTDKINTTAVGCEGIVYAHGGNAEGHCWIKQKRCCEHDNGATAGSGTYSKDFKPVPAYSGEFYLKRTSVIMDDDCKSKVKAALRPFFTEVKPNAVSPTWKSLLGQVSKDTGSGPDGPKVSHKVLDPKNPSTTITVEYDPVALLTEEMQSSPQEQQCKKLRGVGPWYRENDDGWRLFGRITPIKDEYTAGWTQGNFLSTFEGCFEMCLAMKNCVAFIRTARQAFDKWKTMANGGGVELGSTAVDCEEDDANACLAARRGNSGRCIAGIDPDDTNDPPSKCLSPGPFASVRKCQFYASLERDNPSSPLKWSTPVEQPVGNKILQSLAVDPVGNDIPVEGMILGKYDPDEEKTSPCRKQIKAAMAAMQGLVNLDGHYFQALPDGYVLPPDEFDANRRRRNHRRRVTSYTPGYTNYGRYDCHTTHHDINIDKWFGAYDGNGSGRNRGARRRGGDFNTRRRGGGNNPPRRRHGDRRRGQWKDGDLSLLEIGTAGYRLSEQPLGPLTPGNVLAECAKVCTQIVPRCVGFAFVDAQKDYRQEADETLKTKVDTGEKDTVTMELTDIYDKVDSEKDDNDKKGHKWRPEENCEYCTDCIGHAPSGTDSGCDENKDDCDAAYNCDSYSGCEYRGTSWSREELVAQEEERRGTYCCVVYQGANPGKLLRQAERRRHTDPTSGSGDDGSANRRREDKCRRVNQEAPYEDEDPRENPDLEGHTTTVGDVAKPFTCEAADGSKAEDDTWRERNRRRQHQTFPISGHWWTYLRDLAFVQGHILNNDEERYAQRFLAQSEASARAALNVGGENMPPRPYIVQYGLWGSCKIFYDPDLEFRKIPKTLAPRPDSVEKVYQIGGEPDNAEADKECALQCFREPACNAYARPIRDTTCCVLFELADYDPRGREVQEFGTDHEHPDKQTLDKDFVDPDGFEYDDNLDRTSGPFALANREVVDGARFTARLFKLGYEDLGAAEMQPLDETTGVVKHRDPGGQLYDWEQKYTGRPDVGCVRLENTDLRPSPNHRRRDVSRRRHHNEMKHRKAYSDLLEDGKDMKSWVVASIQSADAVWWGQEEVSEESIENAAAPDGDQEESIVGLEEDVWRARADEANVWAKESPQDTLKPGTNGVCVSYRMCFALCAAFKDCLGFVYDRNAIMPGAHPYNDKGVGPEIASGSAWGSGWPDASDYSSGNQGTHDFGENGLPRAEFDGRGHDTLDKERLEHDGTDGTDGADYFEAYWNAGDAVCGANRDQDRMGNETRSCYFLGRENEDYTKWPVGTGTAQGGSWADANNPAAPWNSDPEDDTRLTFKHVKPDGKCCMANTQGDYEAELYQNPGEPNLDTLIMTPTCRNAARDSPQLSLLIDKVIQANEDIDLPSGPTFGAGSDPAPKVKDNLITSANRRRGCHLGSTMTAADLEAAGVPTAIASLYDAGSVCSYTEDDDDE